MLFFVLLAVMECYANGVLMSFLGSGALFVVAPDVHPLYLAPLTVSACVCVCAQAGCEGLLPTVLRTLGSQNTGRFDEKAAYKWLKQNIVVKQISF